MGTQVLNTGRQRRVKETGFIGRQAGSQTGRGSVAGGELEKRRDGYHGDRLRNRCSGMLVGPILTG